MRTILELINKKIPTIEATQQGASEMGKKMLKPIKIDVD